MATSPSSVVTFDHVTKTYATRSNPEAALSDVDFGIGMGEIFGIIGESGAGKSTLLRLINALTTPTEGAVRVLGQEPAELDRAGLRALRRDIGIVFQSVDLLSNRTVRQNVALPFRLRRRGRDGVPAAEARAAVDEMLRFVGLTHRADHYPAQLSGGERQRVGLARALVTQPPVLLCDEPTSSLDSSTTAEVLRILAGARDRYGTTVIVITHDLEVVKALCDRVALLDHGRVRELFTVDKREYGTLPDYYAQVRRELLE